VDTGRSDADVLPNGLAGDGVAGAAAGAGAYGVIGAVPAAVGGGVVELDATAAAATKADLNGGLPDAATIEPVGAAAADNLERAAAAATGGDAFAFGAAAAVTAAAGAGPGATTEEAFEKEAEIKVDPATAFESDVSLDPETAWKERFHDGYWRKVVGALASDEEKWKAAADKAFTLRAEIIAVYTEQRNRDSTRDAVFAVLACLLVAGVGTAGFKFIWQDGGMEVSSVVSFSGGGGRAVLPSRWGILLVSFP
jgi:hypothetical protein